MEAKLKSSLLATAAGLITILILLNNLPATEAQHEISFTPDDKFLLPTLGGEISFAVNGTYSDAELRNETWTFTDLKLTNLQPLKTLTVSAQNSKVVITSYRAANATFRFAWLRYVAEGKGQQAFNIGIPAGDGRWGLHPEWSVIVNNIWLGESDGWTITDDGTVTVTGAVGNVSVIHYGILGSDDASNLPFYQQHSIALATAALVAVTATVSVLINVKGKNSKDHGKNLSTNNYQKYSATREDQE